MVVAATPRQLPSQAIDHTFEANYLSGDAMTALIIRGGTVVNHDHSHRADVLIDGEIIVAIGSALNAPAGAEVVDAGGCFVMPGGIDPHTHLEMPFMGTVTADDFEWGTKAALAMENMSSGRHSRRSTSPIRRESSRPRRRR
jgi:imidazolonepropionase-like amidohydrolase